MTETGSIIGTAHYLSPQQARRSSVTAQSDLYSVGVVLYEMLTGQVPFSGDSLPEIVMKHVTDTPRPPSTVVPGPPPGRGGPPSPPGAGRGAKDNPPRHAPRVGAGDARGGARRATAGEAAAVPARA